MVDTPGHADFGGEVCYYSFYMSFDIHIHTYVHGGVDLLDLYGSLTYHFEPQERKISKTFPLFLLDYIFLFDLRSLELLIYYPCRVIDFDVKIVFFESYLLPMPPQMPARGYFPVCLIKCPACTASLFPNCSKPL